LKLLPRILADDEEEEDRAYERPVAGAEPEAAVVPLHWAWTAGLAAVAAIPRLLYLFVFSDPENPGAVQYGDVWHHWQIAYLTKEIGLSAPNGPRLWDLKGMEYVWGILHPLLMVGVFDVTGSIDIVLNRLVSLAFGVGTVVLLFHLCRRYWGTEVGAGVALFAILLPTSVMNDASGMVEPLGVALCLLGLWAGERQGGLWAGLSWGLAATARAEAWIFGLGMVVASLFRRTVGQSLPLLAGFAAVMLVYMKVLLDQTGNPIYSVWWNFLSAAVGQWQSPTVTAAQASARPALAGALILSAGGLAWSLWKRPRSYMLLTFGFGYWVFVAGMFALTALLTTWMWWFPIGRRFEFPVLFLAVLLVVVWMRWLPRRLPFWSMRVGWGAVVATVLLSQLLWLPIAQVFGPTEATWQATLDESRQLGAWYHQPQYQGHALAVPADRPDITYGLARFGGVEGMHLISEMYGPFNYLPSGYTYADHRDTVNTRVECWLDQTDTRLIAIAPGDKNYHLMLAYNPDWFVYLGTMQEAGWIVEGVSAPHPSGAACRAAQSTSQ
jgi:hypothetical protein